MDSQLYYHWTRLICITFRANDWAYTTGDDFSDAVHSLYFDQLVSGRYLTMQLNRTGEQLEAIEIEIIIAVYDFDFECRGKL